jgi:acyl dehydratase
MSKVEFRDINELRQRIGQEVAVSDWIAVAQERIDKFADATDDHQWIHVERARAAASRFGGTIAHGFLTLSLIPHFMYTTIGLPKATMSVNYGLNRVRFMSPVPAGKRVRARIALLNVEDVGGGQQLSWKITIELEGSEKPACVAETIGRRYE